MAEAVTPNTVHLTSWFTEYQKNHIVKDGVTPKWFHGTISRKQTEEMLMTKPPGYFLIRVSESRIGYTLSYRAEDLCRHFMIDILPGNQCEIVGENVRHCSLYDLVDFHCKTPIRPYNELLTVTCDQVGKNISEDMPPALPARPPIPNQNLSISSDTSVSPPRLYPSLEHELRSLSLDSVGSPLNPAPQSRPKFILTLPEITTKWCSAHAKTTTGGEQTTGLPTASNQRTSKDKVPQKSLAELKFTRININQYKKIFKKKKNHSEEHTYMEINESEVTTEPAALQIDANRDHQEVHGVSGTIPLEYLNPPPFAPGY
ncbi:hematopoietic SH2 domain-containing protein homolog [Ictalurus furcatus]|uniref:hematopoietic SH2 domain-containing protein homolog n=1 Tax=Ictalurus furcatus TaxID=66913 RepID=UPI0023508351|nr:hematopoietic SH2 domain-containing protein homolog [Ictalurus furcatus]XP_053491571.1 hematopoietic SH2 domain-containing protein homolog [Ictalurus furcatus]